MCFGLEDRAAFLTSGWFLLRSRPRLLNSHPAIMIGEPNYSHILGHAPLSSDVLVGLLNGARFTLL